MVGGECAARELRAAQEPFDQRRQRLGRRGRAHAHDTPVAGHQRAARMEQAEKRGAVVLIRGQCGHEVIRPGHLLQQPVLRRHHGLLLAPQLGCFQLVNFEREGVGHQHHQRPRVRRNVVRQAVMPDDQPPQPPDHDDGHGHGTVDAQVALVFQVNRRQRPRPGEGEVHRLVRDGRVGLKGCRRGITVHDETCRTQSV